MTGEQRSFAFVEAQLRKKTFGVLSTISSGGSLQASGILYAVSPPGAVFRLYLLTARSYVKTRNIARNPQVAFLVPYPHALLFFVPSSCISFSGTASIEPLSDPEGRAAFAGNRILARNLAQADASKDGILLRIRPKRSMHCYGIGIGLVRIARSPTETGYSVDIPASRL